MYTYMFLNMGSLLILCSNGQFSKTLSFVYSLGFLFYIRII